MFGSIFGRNDSKEPRQRKDWIPGGQPRPTRPPSAKEPWKPPTNTGNTQQKQRHIPT